MLKSEYDFLQNRLIEKKKNNPYDYKHYCEREE